jgi:hypothetical protein
MHGLSGLSQVEHCLVTFNKCAGAGEPASFLKRHQSHCVSPIGIYKSKVTSDIGRKRKSMF